MIDQAREREITRLAREAVAGVQRLAQARQLSAQEYLFLIDRVRSEIDRAEHGPLGPGSGADDGVPDVELQFAPGAGPSAHRAPAALPAEAPALWLQRADRSQTPPAFIREHYRPWLGKGLTQAHILRLDRSLYNALHKWLRSNPMPPDLDLPTRKQWNDRALAAMGTPTAAQSLGRALKEASPEVRERIRLYDLARRREARRRAEKKMS